MSRVRLTAGRIAAFECPEGKHQAFLWDTEVPGLGVRATRSSKAFVFQATIGERELRLTIGDVRAWDIESGDPAQPGAREEARRLQRLIDQGIDPRHDKADRAAATVAKRTATTLHEAEAAEAWKRYVTDRTPSWGPRHLADHLKIAAAGGVPWKRCTGITGVGPLAPLVALKLREIDGERVKAWLKVEVKRGPTQARLAFALLRAFINWCGDQRDYRDLVHLDACAPRIAKQALPRKASKSDCLLREQLPAWFGAVRGLGNPVLAAYLQCLLLTGARPQEMATLQWDNADFRWARLTIRDKVEGQRPIPMTPYVAHLLSSLPRRGPWVFSSPAAHSGRIVDPSAAHERALLVAGIEGMTLNGLRRSFGTLAEWVECPAGVVAQIMGHKPSATAEKHYRVRPLDLLRIWHEKIEAWMLAEAGVTYEPTNTLHAAA